MLCSNATNQTIQLSPNPQGLTNDSLFGEVVTVGRFGSHAGFRAHSSSSHGPSTEASFVVIGLSLVA